MRAATHGCNEGSIEAGWLGQSHLPVMLNYVPTTYRLMPFASIYICYTRRRVCRYLQFCSYCRTGAMAVKRAVALLL